MKLFHTSQEQIEKIRQDGLFDDGLCFAGSPYGLSDIENIYGLEINEDQIIEACSIAYADWEVIQPIAQELADKIGCTAEEAVDYISECEHLDWNDFDCDCVAEFEWEIQRYALKCAKALGYRGVQLRDEQGAMWLISMFEQENELVLVNDDWREWERE